MKLLGLAKTAQPGADSTGHLLQASLRSLAGQTAVMLCRPGSTTLTRLSVTHPVLVDLSGQPPGEQSTWDGSMTRTVSLCRVLLTHLASLSDNLHRGRSAGRPRKASKP